MKRWIRRLTLLGLLGGGANWFLKSRRKPEPAVASEAMWPPLRLVDEPNQNATPASATSADADDTTETTAPISGHAVAWVAPVDGACPVSHPIKGNDGSKIFHVPGGRSYDRTIPERCYATPEAATADGYRAAKA